MSILHIANTWFEWELMQHTHFSFTQILEKHPVFLQLQFLPFLYGDKTEGVVISSPPPDNFFHSLKDHNIPAIAYELIQKPLSSSYTHLASWGASPILGAWGKERNLKYFFPSWEIVRKIHSKGFAYEHSLQLPGSSLLQDPIEAEEWISSQTTPFVLKTFFGSAGRGNFYIDPKKPYSADKLALFCKREWKEKRGVLAQPWVKRVFDFSTQWEISTTKEISYLGATVCENDFFGKYLSSRVGEEQILFSSHLAYLEQHKKIAGPLLEYIAALGYFGNLGIDAFVYENSVSPCTHLYPVVEINARKTMGWVAIQIQKKHYAKKMLRVNFSPNQEKTFSLLPQSLSLPNGKSVVFSRKLTVEILDN